MLNKKKKKNQLAASEEEAQQPLSERTGPPVPTGAEPRPKLPSTGCKATDSPPAAEEETERQARPQQLGDVAPERKETAVGGGEPRRTSRFSYR